ncbi:Predicted pyrophosphatase or phosphodiesterase, AlkP superfamily [Ectothiorhodospira mobilis]|uniref:Predicted pyrophosphatase or phosphodiesterase, AlkP superfamily n=1 Tax=Ectothiorhodospira mobilis TaxID=195064 RepID=A0A1I4QYS4_ECTMO|nr:alkaline phosphatase family protein [Ectothiorhodospira mobilis]SFM45141.1 Predicted pyrophosphatase or phosphodiesterase, AlkP superfamily [Ectothiorhodospira mobilis]
MDTLNLPAPPDYGGRSLANLMASLSAGLGGPLPPQGPLAALPPEAVGGHRHVVLVLVDGLGDAFLQGQPAPFLNGHRLAGIESVFPTTTASGITTVLTGDTPAVHGLTGWHVHFRELGAVLAVLPGVPRYGGVGYDQAQVDLGRLLGHHSLFDRLPVASALVTPEHIARTPFNAAHQGRARLYPFKGLDHMVEQVVTAVRGGDTPRFVYAYWPDLDARGHEHGPDGAETRRHLQQVDTALAALARRLAGTDTLLLVTADHGMVAARHRADLADHPGIARCLALPLCGEPRVAFAYVRHGWHETFARRVREELGHACTLVPSHRLLERGWFGPGRHHPELETRIGDFALVMHPGWVLQDRILGREPHPMAGVHGGLDRREVEIPLVRALC